MKRYKTVSGYVMRKFLDEYLLIPVNSPEMKKSQLAILNPVGQFLWEQLQDERTLDELVTTVCTEFEVDGETATEDIWGFLEILRSKDCLEEMEEKR